MRKLQFGSGGAGIGVDGWENHDMDVDLRKPLPYEDSSVDFIFTEHCIEHLTPKEAWGYFEECLRILKPKGVVRTTVPSIVKLQALMTPRYIEFVHKNGWGDGTRKGALKHIVSEHGHQSLWCEDLLIAMLHGIGFLSAYECRVHESWFPVLSGVERHWLVVGKEEADQESISVEAVK